MSSKYEECTPGTAAADTKCAEGHVGYCCSIARVTKLPAAGLTIGDTIGLIALGYPTDAMFPKNYCYPKSKLDSLKDNLSDTVPVVGLDIVHYCAGAEFIKATIVAAVATLAASTF